MATESKSQLQDNPSSRGPGHELRDAQPGWVFGIISLLFVTALAIHFTLGGLLKHLKAEPPPTDAWRPGVKPILVPNSNTSFPRLQLSSAIDLESFRAREEIELNNYGWVNRTAGIVRVPIERAMDIVLQQGFPVRNSTNESRIGPSSYELIQQRLPRPQRQTNGRE